MLFSTMEKQSFFKHLSPDAQMDSLDMGDPADFYDAIITAGFPLRKGSAGTLGELSPKLHPWLYADVARIGLGIAPRENAHVLRIEDSSAGVCSIRLANIPVIGIADGNIQQSGTSCLCHYYCDNFKQILSIIREGYNGNHE